MEWPFIWTNLNIHYLKILYAKFLWSRWRRNFLKIVNFLLFHFYRTLEQGLSFRLTNWNPLYPKMFTSAMFGRNSPSGSGGENFLIWPMHFVSQGTDPSFAKKKNDVFSPRSLFEITQCIDLFVWGLSFSTSPLPVKGCKFWPMLGTHGHEQWGFFSVPHLLWHGASVFNGHLRGPVTLTPIAERSAVELSLPVFTT